MGFQNTIQEMANKKSKINIMLLLPFWDKL